MKNMEVDTYPFFSLKKTSQYLGVPFIEPRRGPRDYLDTQAFVIFGKEFQKMVLMSFNPTLGEGGQFDHSIKYSVTIFLALGLGSPKFLTLFLNIKVSTW